MEELIGTLKLARSFTFALSKSKKTVVRTTTTPQSSRPGRSEDMWSYSRILTFVVVTAACPYAHVKQRSSCSSELPPRYAAVNLLIREVTHEKWRRLMADDSTTLNTDTIPVNQFTRGSFVTRIPTSDAIGVNAANSPSIIDPTSDIDSILRRVSCLAGSNSFTNNGAVWIGDDGKWTNTFTNNASQDIVLAVWGENGSWVNTVRPHITVQLRKGASRTISFENGQSGGWAGIYSDTVSVNGQVANTWGEFTFGLYSTVDVSREVKMSGHGMRIQTPNCISDMNTCVFVCQGETESCWLDYELRNCDAGSQAGATKGRSNGADSGGCSNMGQSARLQTIFS